MKYYNYKSVLDAEILEFIKKTEDFYPKSSICSDPSKERVIYNNLCKFFKAPRPKDVETVDFEISQIKLRKYVSAHVSKRIVFFVHGGGWVVGDLESHDDICAEICSKTASIVYAIDYKLAPENKHPAGLNDCEVIFEHIRKVENKNIVLIGDSAGGNLVAALSDKFSAVDKLVGQILIYPALGNILNNGSIKIHREAPMLTASDMAYYNSVYFDSKSYLTDKTARPIISKTLQSIPETHIFVAEFDPLKDDGLFYLAAISKQGGSATFESGDGLVHGYLRARHLSKIANDEFNKILKIINKF